MQIKLPENLLQLILDFRLQIFWQLTCVILATNCQCQHETSVGFTATRVTSNKQERLVSKATRDTGEKGKKY